MAFDLMRGFQVGQGIAGQGTAAPAIRQLLERANQIGLVREQARATVGAAVASKAALMPLELEQSLAVKRGEADIERETARQQMAEIGQLAGQGGGFPPGTTAKIGAITFPLNRELQEGEARALSQAEDVARVTTAARRVIGAAGGGAIIGSKVPTALLGGVRGVAELGGFKGVARGARQAEVIQQLQDQLRGTLPFAFGGKQLTKPEQAAITRLLISVGKDSDRIIRDLDRYNAIFQRTAELIRGGQLAAKSATEIMQEAGVDAEALAQEYFDQGGGDEELNKAFGSMGELGNLPSDVEDLSTPNTLQAQALQELQRRRAHR